MICIHTNFHKIPYSLIHGVTEFLVRYRSTYVLKDTKYPLLNCMDQAG